MKGVIIVLWVCLWKINQFYDLPAVVPQMPVYIWYKRKSKTKRKTSMVKDSAPYPINSRSRKVNKKEFRSQAK